MKIAIIVVRVLLGALFVFSAVVVLFNIKMGEMPKLGPEATAFMTGLMATGYFMKLLKITELVCGILLIVNRWAPLATVMLFPISLNIIFYHVYLTEAKDVPMSVFVLLANLFLAYAYRKNYAGLLATKPL